MPAKPAPPPIKNAILGPPKTQKTTTTTYEVLNPSASPSVTSPEEVSASSASSAGADNDDGADGDGDELPELTPALLRFSRLSLWQYEASFTFIQQNRAVVVPGASDALLVAAFRAQSDGQAEYAKQCVHQSLLLQYCEKLGKDGVRVFFQK